MGDFPNLFSNFKFSNIIFRNRIFDAPNMIVKVEKGLPLDDFMGFTEAKAKGGVAQAIKLS